MSLKFKDIEQFEDPQELQLVLGSDEEEEEDNVTLLQPPSRKAPAGPSSVVNNVNVGGESGGGDLDFNGCESVMCCGWGCCCLYGFAITLMFMIFVFLSYWNNKTFTGGAQCYTNIVVNKIASYL